jgi:hypothetical protein
MGQVQGMGRVMQCEEWRVTLLRGGWSIEMKGVAYGRVYGR